MGDATHRAASASEPYFETASRRSCAWCSGDRRPLSTYDFDPVVRGIRFSLAQGTVESRIERTVSLAPRTSALAASDVAG